MSDTLNILRIIGAWGSLISVIFMAAAGYTALYHPKFKKDKALYELMMTITSISFNVLQFFIFLLILPLFYTSEVPSSIKIGLMIGGVCGMFAVAWSAKISYNRYKRALKMKQIKKFFENQDSTGV